MDVNGVSSTGTSSTSAYSGTSAVKGAKSASSAASSASAASTKSTDTAAVYEKSSAAKNAAANPELIAKLKADTQNRVSQMQNLVSEMFSKQGKAFSTADQMWKMLASGNFTVDAKTAQDAKAAISEDGYWGVNQTSQRIFDFAVALSGGDSDKMDKMLSAFKKGFEQATKSWGKSLPDISSQTYDAVIKKFDDYKNPKTDGVQ